MGGRRSLKATRVSSLRCDVRQCVERNELVTAELVNADSLHTLWRGTSHVVPAVSTAPLLDAVRGHNDSSSVEADLARPHLLYRKRGSVPVDPLLHLVTPDLD